MLNWKKLLRRPRISEILEALLVAALIAAALSVWLAPYFFRRSISAEAMVRWASAELGSRWGCQVLVREAVFDSKGNLSLGGVRISESPDFHQGTLLEADRMKIEVDLISLFFGSVTVDELTLESVRVRVNRLPTGQWNVDRLVRPDGSTPKVLEIDRSGRFGSAAAGIDIDTIVLKDAVVGVDDALDRIPAMRFDLAELKVSRFSTLRPFAISLAGQVQVIGPARSGVLDRYMTLLDQGPKKVSLRGRIATGDGQERPGKFHVALFEVVSSSWNARLGGSLRFGPEMRVEAEGDLKFRGYSEKVNELALTLDGEVKTRLDMSAVDQGLGLRWSLNADQLKGSLKNIFLKKDHSALNWTAEGSWKTSAKQTADSARKPVPKEFSGYLSVRESAAPAPETLQWILRYDLDPSFSGRADERFPQWPRESPADLTPENVRWTLSLSSGLLYAQGLTKLSPWLQRLVGPSQGYLRFDSLAVKSGHGLWSVEGAGVQIREGSTNRPGKTLGAFEGGLDRIAVSGEGGRWKADFSGAIHASRANMPLIHFQDMTAQFEMTGVSNAPKPKINGVARLNLRRGAIKDVDATVKAAPFMKFLIRPLRIFEDLHQLGIIKLKGQNFTSLPMDSLQGDYYFENGSMRLSSVTLQGPLGNVEVSGWVDFPQELINMVVAVNIPKPKVRWSVADALLDERGDAYYFTKIKGPLRKPAVYPVLGPKKDMLKGADARRRALGAAARKIFQKLFHESPLTKKKT